MLHRLDDQVKLMPSRYRLGEREGGRHSLSEPVKFVVA